MGKIVKYCGSCEESFAEKFGFCPTCGTTLEAFEMNPLGDSGGETVPPTPAFINEATPEPVVEQVFTAPEPVEEIAQPIVEASPAIPVVQPIFMQSNPVDIDRITAPAANREDTYSSDRDNGFHITVIEDKNVKQRAKLLMATVGMMVIVLMGSLVYSIFSKDLDIGAINDEMFNALLIEDVPMTVEEEKQQKEDKKGGGGGGGGREEKEETTKGDLADQSKTPTRPPDAKTPRMENPSLRLDPPQTEGNQKFEKKFDRWGDPNGRYASLSNGTGSGGGQGSGRGTGQGSGNGTGAGSGNGSGSGGGNGDGNGDGDGSGSGRGENSPPPSKPAGVTQALSITSKPKPGYTDSARTSNTQGVVILRVTFLASGQIGSISTVKGLPNGLTEKAMEAAKRMTFVPKKIDGVGQAVTKQVEYSFAIF